MRLVLGFTDALLVVLVVALGIMPLVSDWDPLPTFTLALSITVAYLATIRPFLMRPRLRLALDQIRCSAPTVSGDSPSWFIRLRVTNRGLSSAKDCAGRLLGVRTYNGLRLLKFDPLTLYWARQDHHTGHNPLQIHPQGDLDFLDIIQVKSGNAPMAIRAVIPEPMTLSRGEDHSPSPGTDAALKPAKYYLQVAVFSENAGPASCWLEVDCIPTLPPDCTDSIPCSVRFRAPRLGRTSTISHR